MPFQDRADDLALNANAAAMDNPDLTKSTLDRLIQIFLHDDLNLGRLESVQIDGVFDRNLVHSLQYNRRVMKFFVRTYGCQMNVADSNEMSRHLATRGLVQTEDPDEAAVILVNTCTVR